MSSIDDLIEKQLNEVERAGKIEYALEDYHYVANDDRAYDFIQEIENNIDFYDEAGDYLKETCDEAVAYLKSKHYEYDYDPLIKNPIYYYFEGGDSILSKKWIGGVSITESQFFKIIELLDKTDYEYSIVRKTNRKRIQIDNLLDEEFMKLLEVFGLDKEKIY